MNFLVDESDEVAEARLIEEWAYINAANDYLLQQHKFLDDELSDDMKIGFGEETWRDNCGMLLERSQLLQNIKYENDLFDLLLKKYDKEQRTANGIAFLNGKSLNVTSGVNAKLGGKPRPGKTLLPGGDGVDFNRCNLAEIYDYIKNCKAPSRKEKQLAIISSHENPVEKGQIDTKISSRKSDHVVTTDEDMEDEICDGIEGERGSSITHSHKLDDQESHSFKGDDVEASPQQINVNKLPILFQEEYFRQDRSSSMLYQQEVEVPDDWVDCAMYCEKGLEKQATVSSNNESDSGDDDWLIQFDRK